MNELFMHVNTAICILIALRLLLFRRSGCRHKWMISSLAYILIVSAAALAIKAIIGVSVGVDIFQVVLNATVLILVCMAGGNVSRLVNWRRS